MAPTTLRCRRYRGFSRSHRPALPFIEDLAQRDFDATMLYVAIGDALVRLSRKHEHDASRAIATLQGANEMLIDGALRAVAMLRMVPDEASIRKIVDFASRRDPCDGVRFWVAAAAAGWPPEARERLPHDLRARSPGRCEGSSSRITQAQIP